MDEKPTFTIKWILPEDQWEEVRARTIENAPGSSYDRNQLGRYHLLDGDVDFEFAGLPFYGRSPGRGPVNLSLFDLGIALADAYLKHRFDPDAEATFNQLDDDRHIYFRGDDAFIKISANDQPLELHVPREAFQRGVISFLCGLAGEIRRRVEILMQWESMAPLREVVARFCID